MFERLTEFSHKRSTREAVGFYLAYLLMIMVVNLIIESLFGGIRPIYYGDREFLRISIAVCITASLALSFFIITQKKLETDFGYVLLSLASGLLATFGGGLLGLLIPAFLTTLSKNQK